MYKLFYKLQYTKRKPAATRILYAAAVHNEKDKEKSILQEEVEVYVLVPQEEAAPARRWPGRRAYWRTRDSAGRHRSIRHLAMNKKKTIIN